MIKKLMATAAIFIFANMTLQAKENKPLSITTVSYQLITAKTKKGKILKDKKGKPVKKWVKTARVVPGNIIKYVNTVTNNTDTALSDVKISNPINKNLIFIKGSAKSKMKFSTLYSVDSGKSYDVPKKLFVVGKNKKKHLAKASEYNGIQFNIHNVPAKSKVEVEFKVKLK